MGQQWMARRILVGYFLIQDGMQRWESHTISANEIAPSLSLPLPLFLRALEHNLARTHAPATRSLINTRVDARGSLMFCSNTALSDKRNLFKKCSLYPFVLNYIM